MTKYLGRINKLKDSIDTLTYITNSIIILENEQCGNWEKDPQGTLINARELLFQLKKK